MVSISKISGTFFSILICFVFTGCKSNNRSNLKTLDEVIKADEAFSAMSKQQGMKKAFIEYIDNEGILLRPGHLPIIGADAIDYLTGSSDTSFVLTWKPFSGEVSSSEDLGFTYGVYLLQLRDTSISGTYVSIWKKQKDNKWKFILDTGNEGINNDTGTP